MALQTRGADPRLYNPDRDMIWAMPRLMRKALMRFGEEITIQVVRDLLSKRGFTSQIDDETLYSTLEQVLDDLAGYLNELKDSVEVRRSPTLWYQKLFSSDEPNDAYSSIRSLVADFFMSVVYAELPIWFESVQPEQANNPVPTVEEVEQTVDKLLRRNLPTASGGK